jgi:hypothetical protein
MRRSIDWGSGHCPARVAPTTDVIARHVAGDAGAGLAVRKKKERCLLGAAHGERPVTTSRPKPRPVRSAQIRVVRPAPRPQRERFSSPANHTLAYRAQVLNQPRDGTIGFCTSPVLPTLCIASILRIQ